MPVSSQNHDVGQVDAFESGRPYVVRVAGRDVVLVRRGNEFFAIRYVCPHNGAKLSDGLLTGEVSASRPGEQHELLRKDEFLVCPWHGWKIDVRTGCSSLEPDRIRVRRYGVHIEGGRVLVALS